MNERRDLWFIADALLVFVPFSLVGAIFGDAIRRDVLTRRQRGIAGLFTCTLSTAMPDANYVVEFTCAAPSGGVNRYGGEDMTSARTTTVFHLYVNGDGAGAQDPANLNIRVYA